MCTTLPSFPRSSPRYKAGSHYNPFPVPDPKPQEARSWKSEEPSLTGINCPASQSASCVVSGYGSMGPHSHALRGHLNLQVGLLAYESQLHHAPRQPWKAEAALEGRVNSVISRNRSWDIGSFLLVVLSLLQKSEHAVFC